jgi:HEPN domain-containing protein
MSESDPQPAAQWAEARRWFTKASEDLRVADLALRATPAMIEPAACHCQQAAEKLFKGLLVSAAVEVPRTHDLERLAVLIGDTYPQFVQDIAWPFRS